MSDEVGYDLSLAFDSDDPEFTRGVEVGLIYAGVEFMRRLDHDGLMMPIHGYNAEMALRIAERFNLDINVEDINDDWMHVTFIARGEVLDGS